MSAKLVRKAKMQKQQHKKGNKILWISNFKLTGLSLDRRYIQDEYIKYSQLNWLGMKIADFQTIKGTADLKSTN